MKKYRIYRSIRVNNFNEVNLEKMGVSWAVGEWEADRFSAQFNQDYILVSAVVSADQINIAQTNAQWASKDVQHEGEVVLNDVQDIEIEYQGKVYQAFIDQQGNDESRPEPISCEDSFVTDYLEEA